MKQYGERAPAFDAIGYRELMPCIADIRRYPAQINADIRVYPRLDPRLRPTSDGQARESACIAEAVQLIKKNTWHYAKRQMTWLKKDKEIMWIKNPAEGIRLVKKFLSSLRSASRRRSNL